MIKSIGFIGAGNMAHAIISGIRNSGNTTDISAYDINIDSIKKLSEYSVNPVESIDKLIDAVQSIVLSIKPQNINDVLDSIKDKIKPETIIISIVAGVGADYIIKQLGFNAKVVQVMPNTPLLIGEGATAISRTSYVSNKEFEYVKSIFSSSGIVIELPLDKMNAVIPINGSSPAFIYRFAEQFIEYGKSVGILEKDSMKLFAQSLVGSANMMLTSDMSIKDLIEMVSSKGGTTVAGLMAMTEKGFESAISYGCHKCLERADELSLK